MIAAAATFHVQNVAFGEKESYATLESIGVMAEAWSEYGGIDYSSGYINNPRDCIVTETVTCKRGVAIWTPWGTN